MGFHRIPFLQWKSQKNVYRYIRW